MHIGVGNHKKKYPMKKEKNQFLVIVAAVLLLISCVEKVEQRNLSLATPEAVGMSTERLDRLIQSMQKEVDEGNTAGISTMIARHGKIVHFETYGYQNLESNIPIDKNTIFRIYSMSKPITGVALMMLYEEGKFNLSDPVSKYIPEFKGLKVVENTLDPNPKLVNAEHEMTIRELMSHSAGLSYGAFSNTNVDSLYREAELLNYNSTLKKMITSLSKIPLRYQPGEEFVYSVSVDVQGYLVEVLSGLSFRDYLKERLFTPLKMRDTDFHVPEAKHDRLAQIYTRKKGEELKEAKEFYTSDLNAIREPGTFFSGGGGLVSTTMDYMRFCQMLLNGGELEGVRILAPRTVDLMSQNQLPDGVKGPEGEDFGIGFSIVKDGRNGSSIGQYAWGGAAGTWFWIDPVEDLIFVGMRQQFGERPMLGSTASKLTNQAIIKSNQ
jgi:CubicO group peptidase (beta-lactamase class C family)